jgi:hypothetical protein
MQGTSPPKVVVFDLDETLGYFTEFAMFFDMLTKYLNLRERLHQKVFNKVFELYPEYLRPHILFILTFLKTKKLTGECTKVLIYTNNRGPPAWANMIKTYLEHKISYNLFDKVVGAFKVNGKIVEVCRRSNEKTTDDLMRCAKLPMDTHICFIDDTHYEKMDNVYYIKLNPYVHNIHINTLVGRFLNTSLVDEWHIDKDKFTRYVNKKRETYNYRYIPKDDDEYDIDKIVSKKLYTFLEDFF